MVDVLMAFRHTFQDEAEADGSGAAMDVGGLGWVGIQIEGISNASVSFEATIDGSNWETLQVTKQDDGNKVTTATADGLFWANVAGLDQVRCPVSSYVAGTIRVTGKGIARNSALFEEAEVVE